MTTLNARANQAWDEHLKTSDEVWSSDEEIAFEEGWETGYKARTAELPTREQIAKALHEDYMGDPWDNEGCNDTGGGEHQSCKESYLAQADAVLALFGGVTTDE